MTWKQLKTAALWKMFSGSDGRVNEKDDNSKDYVGAMPAAANEAVFRICSAGKPLKKTAEFEAAADKKVYDISEIAPDFKSVGARPELYLVSADGLKEIDGAVFAGKYLVLLGGSGTVLFGYEAAPAPIPDAPADDYELPLDEDANSIIPLYVAAEIYKDDDISTATLWMNEFETKLDALTNKDSGRQGGTFYSANGW